MRSRASAEVAVVGAGICGLSTAHALQERGIPVRVYEARAPGEAQSGGEGRIFRHAHDDPRLARFARESRAVWREWEAELGVELVSRDGAVAIGAAADRRLDVLEAVGGMPVRRIGAEELAECLPVLAGYDGPAVLDEGGGSIRTRAAVAALAGRLGDALVREEVLALRGTPAGTVEVRTGGGRAEHAAAVVCAGRATPRLARDAGLDLPVALAAHARVTFEVRGRPPRRLAALQDSSATWGERATYASAEPGNGRYGVGVAENAAARADGGVDPEALAGIAERACAYVARALPGLDPEPAGHRHCWVTTLPWGDDGVGVWEAGPIAFLAGNNLFKLAPALGRALAGAATGDGLPDPLRPGARLGAHPAAGVPAGTHG